MDTKIIDQIRNILNKTVENGASEAEAASAAGMAQKLLAKHRLTMADLSEMTEEKAKEGFEFKTNFKDEGVENGARIAEWKYTLFGAVCRANGCEPIFYSYTVSRGGFGARGKKMHKLCVIGEEHDAVLAQAFYCHLRDTIEAMAKRSQPRGLDRGEGKSWANSFKVGVTHAIYHRLDKAEKEAQDEVVAALPAGSSCTALARLGDQSDALAAYMKKEHPKLKARQRSNASIYGEAYHQGRRKGEGMNLTTNVLR